MGDYFKETKKALESKIPAYDTPDFEKFKNKIRERLKSNETEHILLIRTLKTLILGDWNSKEKKQRLQDIKNTFLNTGLYAETIDSYYDMNKTDGLSPHQILRHCCIHHQLIVFIDGEGKGTLTEQNYLADTYKLHKKIIYFIEEAKFDTLKNTPSSYVKDFPAIITYKDSKDLSDKILVYSRLRLHRLAGIIEKQSLSNRGLKNPKYMPWNRRLP